MLYQGRWANEDAAGLVESVRYLPSRDVNVVDVRELRRIALDLFAISRRTDVKWFDIAEVRVVTDAQYVPSQDAYRIMGTNDGYAAVAPLDESAKKVAAEEYRLLKAQMLRTTALSAVVGTFASALIFDFDIARAFGYGAVASLLYLAMLQRSVDSVGSTSPAVRLLSLRLAVPILPFVTVAVTKTSMGYELLGSISRAETLAVVLGLLTYKVPLISRTAGEFVDGLADIEIGKTGMLGTVASLTARQIQRKRDAKDQPIKEEPVSSKPVFVFAGPSGAGKSTLIRRLMQQFPTIFDFSISHTTRAMREGEQNGKDYNFVTVEQFQDMIEKGDFVEYASVHGQYYGTSFDAVNNVLKENNICILDVDVQGVEAIRAKKDLDWRIRFIWVSPPSLSVLEERLRARGTETEKTLKTRLSTATRELSFAATSNIFDLTIINDDLDRAYDELRTFINSEIDRSQE